MPASNGRQFVRYVFYKVRPKWRRLDRAEKAAGKKELAAVVAEFSDRMMVRPYGLMGTRGDADFLLWLVGDRLELFQSMAAGIHSTRMGGYLDTPYSYLAMTRRSIYVDQHQHPGQEGTRLRIQPQGSRYLFVYPFVKTRAWYALPLDQRQEMMNAHIAMGHQYPTVKINTSYSFGLDDQEFVVSFESDSPSDFLDLVMELREAKASQYTLRDTPVFTGIAMSIEDALEALGS